MRLSRIEAAQIADAIPIVRAWLLVRCCILGNCALASCNAASVATITRFPFLARGSTRLDQSLELRQICEPESRALSLRDEAPMFELNECIRQIGNP